MTPMPQALAAIVLAAGVVAVPVAASAATALVDHAVARTSVLPETVVTDPLNTAATDEAAAAAFDPLAPRPEARLLQEGPATATLPTVAVGGAMAPAPEPTTWAMMLLGFGGAGALLRTRRRGGGTPYRLVEVLPGGAETCEEFVAPDDATALKRAAAVAEGAIELWRGDVRIAPALNA